jgi:hypothetical protein
MSTRVEAVLVAVVVGAGAACAQAQDRPPATKVVTKTLVKSEAHKECFSMPGAQTLYYRFRADAPLDFKLSHQDDKEVIDIKRDKVANGSGSYLSKKAFDYCMVWTNSGPKAATLHYEYQRGAP